MTGTSDKMKGVLLSNRPRSREENVSTSDTGRDWNADGSNIQGETADVQRHKG